MEKGTYSGRRLHFDRYVAYCFRPYLFTDELRGNYGCGASALALLTGALPEAISRKNNDSHYADHFMIRFLRSHGLKVLRLTQSNIAAAWSHIEIRHVILISQMLRQREATWGVINCGMYYHNFQIYFLDSLTLIRKPIVSAYLVMHPMWRNCSIEWEEGSPKCKIPGSAMSFSTLGSAVRKSRRSVS